MTTHSSMRDDNVRDRRGKFGIFGLLFLLFLAIFGGVIYPQLTGSSVRIVTGSQGAGASSTTIGKASNPPGERINPIAVNTAFTIGNGRLKVNALKRNMSAEIEAMNSFNRNPGLGEEWILINVTFICDLTGGRVCNASSIDFELEGESGQIYNDNFIVFLDNKLRGDVAGGSEINGDIAFIVRENETKLLLMVANAGKRVYFSIGD